MYFIAVGVVILIIAGGVLAHAVQIDHQRSVNVINRASASALLAVLGGIQNDLRLAARYAVQDALWSVGKNAGAFKTDEARELAIESLAASNFGKRLAELPDVYRKHDPRVRLEVRSSNVIFDLREGEGGFALARVKLPEGTKLRIGSWDNSLSLELPCEDLEVFVDSRYFLLEERMRDFIDGLENVGTIWATMEYIYAWAEAWARRRVGLDQSRSKALFELAWAVHELSSFGSADYGAAILGLMRAAGKPEDFLSELENLTSLLPLLRAADVETMRGCFEQALEALGEASASVGKAKCKVEEVKGLSSMLGSSENFESATENIRRKLLEAVKDIERARNHVREVGKHFQRLIDFTFSSAEGNALMAELHEGLIGGIRGGLLVSYPSPAQQVKHGVEGTDAKLADLEKRVRDFAMGIAEGGKKGVKDMIASFCTEFKSSLEDLLEEPTPKRFVKFDAGREGWLDLKVEGAPVYVDGKEDGTIGSLKVILQNISRNFDQMLEVWKKGQPDGIRKFKIEEALARKLKLDTFLNLDRGKLYELLPPPPIRLEPGLSVFREFKIQEVEYRREDPAGLLGLPTPTPVPLWFIGVTLWWAQWDVTLKLGEGGFEEIFDFKNPTLLRTHELPSGPVVVHKPLSYRHEVPKRTFGFRLVIIALKPFLTF